VTIDPIAVASSVTRRLDRAYLSSNAEILEVSDLLARALHEGQTS
jgi:hypothetical protein